ncbi:hypothetical protein BH18ACT9_BH18ACT9_12500 [soil metagenome]
MDVVAARCGTLRRVPSTPCWAAPRRASAAIAVVCSLTLSLGCSRDDTGASSSRQPSAPQLPKTSDPVKLNPDDFTTDIDNTYWPMQPGTRWTYKETDENGEVLRVVVTVTSATRKVANGITARVVRDTVSHAGEVIEDTFDWYAQDSTGTVWYLGEDTAEFDDGHMKTRAGSFEAGVDGAMAGVIMPDEPTVGMAYRQEYYEGEAEDNGEILSLEEMADVPAGHFDQVLMTKDTITIEPDVLEYKVYAPEVGPVLILGVSGGGGREQLVATTKVSAEVARAAGATPLGNPYG